MRDENEKSVHLASRKPRKEAWEKKGILTPVGLAVNPELTSHFTKKLPILLEKCIFKNFKRQT